MSRIKPKQSVRQSKASQHCFRIFIPTILVLTAIISSVKTATCPSSVSSSAAKTSEQCSFTGYTTGTYGIVGGSVSNSLYYFYRLSSTPNSAAVRKVDASGSLTWMASFTFNQLFKSLSVDAAEQSVYLASSSYPLTVLKLSSSDGSVVSQHQL